MSTANSSSCTLEELNKVFFFLGDSSTGNKLSSEEESGSDHALDTLLAVLSLSKKKITTIILSNSIFCLASMSVGYI